MASVAELRELDEAHRQQQAENAAALVLALNATWRQVDPSALARTGTNWLAEAIALIVGRRRRSGDLALAYARDIRALRLPGVLPLTPPMLPDPNLVQLRKSLTYVGLAATAIDLAKIPSQRAINDLTRAGTPERLEDLLDDNERIGRENQSIDEMTREVMARAQQRVGQAAVRHAQNGGRDAVDTWVKSDRRALGWIRITRPACCGWCAMLASRGPVYAEDSFKESDARFDGPGEHKVHDECGCGLRPVYTRDEAEWTDLSREAEQLWINGNPEGWTGQGAYKPPAKLSGDAARTEFRRIWRLRNASMQ